MRDGVAVEAQRAGQCVEDLLGRVRAAALLEADVVVDAHAREHRDLLAPQPLDAATAEIRDADVLGAHERAPRAQELAEGVGGVHSLRC